MDKIEKIRQEIKRRKSLLTQHSKLTYDLILETFIKEYDDLLFFLDTLSEESSEDLEEAAEKYALLFDDGTKWKDGGKYEGFIAGARWQKEQEHICDSAQFEEGFKTGLEIGLRRQKEQLKNKENENTI